MITTGNSISTSKRIKILQLKVRGGGVMILIKNTDK